MTDPLQGPALQELAARLEFYRELGIYDFYRRDADEVTHAMAVTAVADVEVETPQAAPPLAKAPHSVPVTPPPASLPPAIPAP